MTADDRIGSLDVALAADMHRGQIACFIQELGGEFYADAGMMRDALESGRVFESLRTWWTPRSSRRPDTPHSTTWNSIHELAVRGALPPRSVAIACK